VDALVTDGRRPVTGLTAKDFEIRDNGVVQTITDLQFGTLPLDIVCVLDASGSLAGEPLGYLKDAYAGVIDALSDEDRMALITFTNAVKLRSSLTPDRAKLRSLAGNLPAGGTTSLFEAMFASLSLREADTGRMLLLLLSDGQDSSSWLTARQVVDAVKLTDLVIYPVTVRTPRQIETATRGMGEFSLGAFPGGPPTVSQPKMRRPVTTDADRFLDALAAESGGRVLYANEEGGLAPAFIAVLKEFRQRYVLSYQPSQGASKGWHKIEVKLKGKSGEVRARPGYFVQ
jgi:VWFA-related protein